MIRTENVAIESVERELVGERDERIVIHADAGWTFAGVLERNCYREESPDGGTRTRSHYLIAGRRLRIWGGLGAPVHQVEAILDDPEPAPDHAWHWDGADRVVTVWDTTNDFSTLAESEASADEYVAFIEREGELIATRIDEGMEPAVIDAMMDSGHSGNTAAWAWRIGTEKAKDQEAAQRARDYWNAKWAPDQDVAPGGLVNPAVLVVGDAES
jgi:hypothetical protein